MVVSWLSKFRANYIRLNFENASRLNRFIILDESVNLSINEVNLSQVSIVWHRRGRFRLLLKELNGLGNLTYYLKKEEDSLIKSIENCLRKNVPNVGSYLKEVENYKVNHLLIARECGISIPETIITTIKSQLIEFYDLHDKVITKDLRYPLSIEVKKGKIHSSGIFIVTNKMIEKMNDNFAPILLQKYVEK